MHGFEYSFAGLLCAVGRYEDGIKVVKAIRDKYDGKKRNPWNEMECGSNYARSMSSFALLPILSGFEFHLPKKYIGFCPLVHNEDFRSFFSVGTGWGTFSVQKNRVLINLEEGVLNLKSIGLAFAKGIESVTIDGVEKDYVFVESKIIFAECVIEDSIEVIISK